MSEHSAENDVHVPVSELGIGPCDPGIPGNAESGLTPDGYNVNGVAMCKCKKYGPVHVWEPGEWCSPTRVIPPSESNEGSPA